VFNTSVEQDNVGHKRSFSAVLQLLQARGHDVNLLMHKVEAIVLKTFAAAYPQLRQQYAANSNGRPDMCF
jgi:tubulin polyglutamylase TTLL6/13